MESVLIAGVESVVGANLAASLSDRSQVFGLSFSIPVSLAYCDTGVCDPDDAEEIGHWISKTTPDRIVYCGSAAHSSWQCAEAHSCHEEIDDTRSVQAWASAARDSDSLLTYVSTDAVFSGPWMFHKEESSSLCSSSRANALRKIEKIVLQTAPDALIARTNVYGWSPESTGSGWIEQILDDLESGCAGPFDYLRHATPILATDFASILCKAWENSLAGIYHIAGAERVNPNQFVERLADEFRVPAPSPVDGNSLFERPTGLGCGECSLLTNRIRKALNIAMPTLSDGLRKLREQKLNGFSGRLEVGREAGLEKVA